MTKRTCYTAKIGAHTFQRFSHRTYTHCVISAGSLLRDRERTERNAHHNWRLNLAYLEHTAKGQPGPGCTYEVSPAEQQDAARILALGEDGLVAEKLAEFDAKHAGQPDHYWIVEGWCGRADLAATLAKRAGGTSVILVAEAA